jgi:hypothetical protein
LILVASAGTGIEKAFSKMLPGVRRMAREEPWVDVSVEAGYGWPGQNTSVFLKKSFRKQTFPSLNCIRVTPSFS